jgi:glucose-6-phosphate isomerase
MRIDGHDVVPDVHAVLDHMGEFTQRLRDGTWLEHTGRPIRNIVNIGIGGSYLAVIMQRFDGYAALDGGFA